MEGILGIFKSIISLNSDLCAEYLDALEEHQSFAITTSQKGTDEIVQTISSLLAKRESRPLGLLLLNKLVGQCASIELLEQKGSLWTSLVLKSTNSVNELETQAELVYDTLIKLAEKAQHSPDLTKSFASNHLPKIYQSLAQVPLTGQLAALRCVETCLSLYAGPSGPSRGTIERYLLHLIDTPNEQLCRNAGKCLHLLQQVRSGQGVNQKTQWQQYHLKLLFSAHAVLDETFSKCRELYDFESSRGDKLDVPELQLSDEPVERVGQLFLRFRNLIIYLETALSEPFPVEKPIMAKKLLNLINRGLSMTCTMLQRNAITDNLALGTLLPKMQSHILQLLQTLLLTLRTHLRMHHELILGMLADTLKWTSTKYSIGLKKPLIKLRVKIYELLSLWTSMFHSGSRCELIAELMIPEILKDIQPYQSEFTLKVLSGARKHMSKKARRQLHKAQNEQSNITHVHANNPIRKEDLSDEGNQLLCIAALRCLQNALLASAQFLKPTVIKIIHNKILQICGLFYELPLRRQHLYAHWSCRLEIYHCLYVMLVTPHHLCPPPTQMCLSILQTAQLRDGNIQVRVKCGSFLLELEKLIHSQKEGLLFPVEARDIRNAFLKYGKECLLDGTMLTNEMTVDEQCSSAEEEIGVECVQIDAENGQVIVTNNIEKLNSVVDISETVEGDINLEQTEAILETKVVELHSSSSEDEIEMQKNPTPTKSPSKRKIIEERIAAESIEVNSNDSFYAENVHIIEEIVLIPPTAKKTKLESNKNPTNETIKIDEKLDSSKLPSTVEIDEDLLVADIESAFVDELN